MVYEAGNTSRGRKIATNDTGYFLVYGTENQPAEPWLRPAFQAKAPDAITTIEKALADGVDRLAQKYLKR